MPRMSKFTLNASSACDAPKEYASVHTNTEPWQPFRAAQPNAVDVAEYTRALNYINSIHRLINHTLSRPVFKKCNGTPHVSMPDLPNFLTIMSNLGEMCMEKNLRTAEKATSTTNLSKFEKLEKQLAEQPPPQHARLMDEKNSDSDETSREEVPSPNNDQGRIRTFYLMHGDEDVRAKLQKPAKADKHAKNSKAKQFLVQEGGDGQNVKSKKQSVNVYPVQTCQNNERRDQRADRPDNAELGLSEADLHRYASELLVGANWDYGKNYHMQQTGHESPGSSKSSLAQEDDYVAPNLERPRRAHRKKDKPSKIPTRECCSFTCPHQQSDTRPEDVKPFKSAMKVHAVEMGDPSPVRKHGDLAHKAAEKPQHSPFTKRSKGGAGVWKVMPYEVQQKECDDFLRPRRGRKEQHAKEREVAVASKDSSGQLNKAFDGYSIPCQKVKQQQQPTKTTVKDSRMLVTGECDVMSFMSTKRGQTARNKAFRQTRKHDDDGDDVVTLTGCYKAEGSCSDTNNSYNSESSDIKSDRELAPSKAHPQKHILYVHKPRT